MRRLAFLSAALAAACPSFAALGPRCNPDDQVRFFWYMCREYYPQAVEAGFNTFINAYGSNFGFSSPTGKAKSIAGKRDFLDQMERDGVDHIEQVKSSQSNVMKKRYPQRKKDGSPNLRSIDLDDAEAYGLLMDQAKVIAESIRDKPAVVGVQCATEVRDGSIPSWTEAFAEKCRRANGFDRFDSVGIHFNRVRDFPVSRVIPADWPRFRYATWFWKEGDRWNRYNEDVAAIFDKAFGRKLFSMYDPIVRTPPVWGMGGRITCGNQWFYETPEPFGVSWVVSEQMAMARGTPGQRVFTMLQGIAYRNRVAPKERKVENAPAWVAERPNATYITMPPDLMRESMWTLFSRQVDGVGVYAVNALYDYAAIGSTPKDAAAYQMTNPESIRAIADAFRRAGVPLGPLLKAIPERAPEVALLVGAASAFFGGETSYGWGWRWGDLLVAANLQPYALFEEEIARDGLPPSLKVLVLPGCVAMTRETYKAVCAFQKRGGIIAADEYLVPGILPDVRLTDGLLSRYDRAFNAGRDREKLREGVERLRSDLAFAYAPYADSDNRDIVVHARSCGDADYVFAVNDRRTFGDYVGQWKMVPEKGLPNAGSVSVRRAAGAVYDLERHRSVPFQVKDGKTTVSVSYETTDGRILMAVSKPLGKLAVKVAGGTVTVTSDDRDVLVPIEVTRTGEKPFYGVVRDGRWSHAFGRADGLCVRNLATGETFSQHTKGMNE